MPPQTAAEAFQDRVIHRQLLALRVRESLLREQLVDFDAAMREIQLLLAGRLHNVPDLGFDTTPAKSGRLRQIFAATDSIIGEAYQGLYAGISEALYEVAKLEASWAVAALKEALPSAFRLLSPGANQLRSIAVSRPFQGGLLKDWYKGLEQATKQAVRREVQLGLQQGQSVQNIVRRLAGTKAQGFKDGVLQAPRRQIEAVVRTSANHVSNHGREAAYSANSNAIRGVRYVATLDSRTTLTCASLDGQIFPLDSGPRPPMHWNCRSTTTPVLRSWRELGFDFDDLPAGTRASLNGQVPASLTFEDWFKQQPPSFQKDYLGPGRFAAYQDGKTIKDMLNASWKPLPVSALKAA